LRWLLTWSGGTATAPTCGSAGISSASAWATRREPPGAFWLAFHFLNRGDFARGGWLARARRLLDDGQHDCAEQGYVLLPLAIQRIDEGDWRAHAPSPARPLRSVAASVISTW